MKKILIVLLMVGFIVQAKELPKTSSLAKGTIDDPLLNRARAYLDKGKLKIAVENYGIFRVLHRHRDYGAISNTFQICH